MDISIQKIKTMCYGQSRPRSAEQATFGGTGRVRWNKSRSAEQATFGGAGHVRQSKPNMAEYGILAES